MRAITQYGCAESLRVATLTCLLCVAPLLSCEGGQSGDEGASGPRADAAVDAGEGDTSVPPIMGGPGEQPPVLVCKSDADCRRYVEAYIDERIAPPRPSAGGSTLEIAQCVEGCGRDGVCACMYRYAERQSLDALELHVLGAAEDCDAVSRARYCLAEASEFAGCSPELADSCEAACLDLREALEADARALEVTVAAARCDAGRCLSVWEVDGHCLVGAPIPTGGGEVTCAESYDAVLDELSASLGPAPQEPPSGSDAPPPSMSGGAGAGVAAAEGGAPRASPYNEIYPGGPIEPGSWGNSTDDDGAVWVTGTICGAEIGPLCVDGPCPEPDTGDGES